MAYKDISRGVRLAADHAKYMAWLAKDTEARQAAYATVNTPANKVKTDRASGYIVPFNLTGSTMVYVPAKIISTTQAGRGAELANTIRGILNNYTTTGTEFEALTTPASLSDAKKFKFAKLTVIQRVVTATQKSNSRITGRQYYKHENDSVTASFGKHVIADTYATVTAAIKADNAFEALFTGSANALASKYRFMPEA